MASGKSAFGKPARKKRTPELSTMTQAQASALSPGQKVTASGGDDTVLRVSTQRRTYDATNPTDARSLQTVSVPYRVTTVTLQNSWGQRYKQTFSAEPQARATAAQRWRRRLESRNA